MSDAAPAPAPAKKATKARKPAKKADHPPVASMVNAAIKNLKDRKGSSLSAIKKYIAANYKVDVQRLAPFIRKYLKKAVETGKLTQTKGSGATGSFKLAKADKEEKPKKKPAAKKAKKPKSPKKAAAKPKKAKTPKKKAAAKPKKPKTPKKAKTPKKPKAAKPKKAKTPKKKPAAKKAAKNLK